MTTYYLDFETDTLNRRYPDPTKDRIMTIQYQQFYDDSGHPAEELQVLKSWESSERDIIERFLAATGWYDAYKTNNLNGVWNFIPAGMNLSYEFILLHTRSAALLNFDLPLDFLFRLPHYDVKTVLLLANRGKFKGSGLHNFSKKVGTGEDAIHYIRAGDWDKLLSYIKNEAEAFLDVYSFLVNKLPGLFRSYLV